MNTTLLQLLSGCLLFVAMVAQAAEFPPPPLKGVYDYYVFNGTSKNVVFSANFNSPFNYAGTVNGNGKTTKVSGQGYGTSTLTVGDANDSAGECVVASTGGTSPLSMRQTTDGSQGFNCYLSGQTVVLVTAQKK